MYVKMYREGAMFLYECDSLIMEPITKPDEDVKILFTLQDKNGQSLVVLVPEKEGDQVYVMNNDGKTIDRYLWDKQVLPATIGI